MFRMMSETIYPLFRGIPRAYAHINGSEQFPDVKGMVLFYPYENGTVVVADIGGLPISQGDGAMRSGMMNNGMMNDGMINNGMINNGMINNEMMNGGMMNNGMMGNQPILGFHIHEGFVCTGTAEDPFADAGMHYSRENTMHPGHDGDMPVLFVNQGKAWMAFFTDRFTADEVRGRTVIVHEMPDDFRTNPAGNSGRKIACGVIR